MLSRNVKEEYQSSKVFPWENLKSLFNSADLVAGNLEGAVGESENLLKSENGSPVFNIDGEDISLLQKAGFRIITIENNHSLDFGVDGKRKTIDILREDSLTAVFLENSPQFFTIKDVVISVLSLNTVAGRDGSKNQIPSIDFQQKLRLARSLSNLVVVSIHWGSELLDWPSREQREAADWLTKNGVDIIIGSHPHVIQKPELVNGKPVFFSLGNHLFDQKYPRTKEGLIADIRIRNGKFQCYEITTHTGHDTFYPELSDTNEGEIGSIQYGNPTLKLKNYSFRPLSVPEGYENKTILQACQNGKVVWETNAIPLISISSFKPDEENEYLFTLEKHYSKLDNENDIRPYVYGLDDKGLFALWRGSALSWPLIDAQISSIDKKILCALHRGDSFINPDKKTISKRIGAYQWNGFGFRGLSDSLSCLMCNELFGK